MKTNRLLRCLHHDTVTGIPSDYRPRFRPRRLTMPVDSWNIYGAKRSTTKLNDQVVDARNLRRGAAQGQFALKLGEVPKEKTQGDLYRLVWDGCVASRHVDPLNVVSATTVRKKGEARQSLVNEFTTEEQLCEHLTHELLLLESQLGVRLRAEKKPPTVDHQTWALCQSLVALNDALVATASSSSSPPTTLSTSFHQSTSSSSEAFVDQFDLDAKCAGAPSPSSTQVMDPSAGAQAVQLHRSQRVWEYLSRTTLDSPPHGFLAHRGKALVEGTLLRTLYRRYPRMRSTQAQTMLAKHVGLLPCASVALRLGIVAMCGIQSDVGLWREMNTLTFRIQTARRMATAHKQRAELAKDAVSGKENERRWYWRRVLRASARRLQSLAVKRQDIQPRMEWLRSLLFQVIAAVEALEGPTVAEALIQSLFCPQLKTFVNANATADHAFVVLKVIEQNAVIIKELVARATTLGDAVDNVKKLYVLHSRRFAPLSNDTAVDTDAVTDEDFRDPTLHPLTKAAALRRAQFQSSGGAVSTQTLIDPIEDQYRVARHRHQAPATVVSLVAPPNAFREIQLVLKYDPAVAPWLRDAHLDMEHVTTNVIEVHETASYSPLYSAQQFRPSQYRVVRLFGIEKTPAAAAGGKTTERRPPRQACLGEGKGETDQLAMQEACMHALLHYYLLQPAESSSPSVESRRPQTTPESKEETVNPANGGDNFDGNDVGTNELRDDAEMNAQRRKHVEVNEYFF